MASAELSELIEIIKKGEQEMAALEGGLQPADKVLRKVRKIITELRATAARHGVKGLSSAAAKLAEYANAPSLGPEQFMALNFAFEALRRGIEDATPEAVRSSIVEAMELLGFEPLELSVKDLRSRRPSGSSTSVQALGSLDGSRTSHEEESSGMIGLKRAAETLGGKLDTSFGAGGELFRLEFPAASLEKIKFLLSPFDPDEDFSHVLPSQDERSNKILKSIKEFMASFAEGNLEHAQQILEDLAGFQGEDELYQEIGTLARIIHDSIRDLSKTLTPDFRELVENKIPDSENRLEHLLKLTEEAATTTLDHAEAIQNRMRQDQDRLLRLEKHLARLKPIGDAAHERMDDSARILQELKKSVSRTQEHLTTILTSQSYQDLTGQVIQKIVAFQKDLESKLIKLVQTFGVKGGVVKKQEKELYGPAHDKVAGAVHSQDEIDSLLAEFGF
ncbi:MAG: protein phosphatase CheZ [Syntrophobacteraceae bacterium]|nr:protein phosphatase CheZ [Syntrophobacteraceae bacterium]